MKYFAKGKVTHTVQLTGRDIIEMLADIGLDIPVPMLGVSEAEIKFEVPGGGDYSNCSVDFKDEPRVSVSWSVES